jgi:ubiquinone/menaquinone biosynthesis C-methylase UbiE
VSNSQTKKQGKDGIELSSLEWLLLHHRVKLLERQEIIRKLDIQRGDHVLDLGCGPGLWTQILADAVGPAGRVVGVDFDEDHLAYARRLTDVSHPDSDIHYRPLDFSRIADLNETFDVVYFSNCFCYLPDPSPVIEHIKRIIRPGGRVIGRNWDGGPFLLYPMREQLLSLVQHQIANVLEDTSDDAYFDHYLGRKMPGIFRRHGFNHVTCYTQIIERFGAADSDLATYIKLNGEWMGDKVAGSVDAETLAEWLACFDPGDPRCVFESDEFYFCMTEMAVTGYV